MSNLAGLLELDHILNRLPVVVFRLDPEVRHTYVNRLFCESVGRPAAEVLGRGPEALGFPPELARQLRDAVRKALETGHPLEIEFEVQLPGGRQRVLSLLTPEFGPDGTAAGVLGIATDATRLQAIEDSLRSREARFQVQKLESLGVLAAGIAHDFNNVLTGVVGHASLAREQRNDPAALDECLRNIEGAALRAAGLCQQMLAFAGRGQFTTQVTDLNLLASEMIHLLMAAIGKKANLRFNLGTNLPPVRCDAPQVRQLLLNLVTNASDAIGGEGGVITVTTGLIDADRKYLADLGDVGGGTLEPGRYVFLEVADTGCGMTDDVRARAFDPFFTTKPVGRGLGLAAVQGIVRGHHGAIKVASRPGIGSTFTVLLPAVEDRPSRRP